MDKYFVYSKAGEEAGKKNKNVSSREKAANVLGISPMSLNNYETGVTIPPPKVVAKMSEAYGLPKMKHFYCKNICEMKAAFIPELDINTENVDMERLTLRLLKALRVIPSMKERLVDIATDGIVCEDEREMFQMILDN